MTISAPSIIKATPERLAALKAKVDRYVILEEKERCEENLLEFMKGSWSSVDSAPFMDSWAIDAMCDHLEAVTLGYIPRLLINIPPRCTKTTLVSIIYPAWTWARSEVSFLSGPQVRFLCASYNHSLSLDSSNKSRRLLFSPWYQKLWPGKIIMQKDQDTKGQYDNTAGGSRIATSVGGSLLGLGGDVLIGDDLNNTEQVESEADRAQVLTFWNEFHSTRLNDPKKSAIIAVQQRLHEHDVSGMILDSDEDWVHLCLPMHYDERRPCITVKLPQYDDDEPWTDTREDGELLWPERFGPLEVKKLEDALGPYMAAGRLEQSPVPKGGGIIKRDWWQPWDQEEARRYGLEWNGGLKEFPHFELVVGSLDTSYGEKQENDYNALTVWGVWIDRNRNRRAMLMYAWRKRLPLHGKIVSAFPNEAKVNFEQRQKEAWGLVELVADTCKRYKVKRLLIEDKTRGRDVANEINRLYTRENWGVELINPIGDKVSRVHSIVPLFTDNTVWSPDTKWAEMVIQECQSFPKADHDDLCFVAGTLIATRRGNIPIEDVSTLDEVLTPAGWAKVSACGFTGVREVISRASLTGTPKHPIFTLDQGFQPLDTVTQFSQIVGLKICDLIRTIRQKKWCSTVSFTDGWVGSVDTICHNPGAMLGGEKPKDCMSLFGNFTMAAMFRLAMKFITKTMTPLIVAMTIWIAYRRACTEAYLKTLIWNLSEKISIELGRWQVFGINQMKVEHGTAMFLQKHWIKSEVDRAKSKGQETVFGVEKSSNIKAREKYFAPNFAVVPNQNTQEVCELVSTKTMRPVFNLTVEGVHCYYANGVLVHNCDTVSMYLGWARENGILVRADEMTASLVDEMRFVPQGQSIAQSYGV